MCRVRNRSAHLRIVPAPPRHPAASTRPTRAPVLAAPTAAPTPAAPPPTTRTSYLSFMVIPYRYSFCEHPRSSPIRTENEPCAADSANHRGFIWSVDLATQSTHVHIDKVCFRKEFVVPYVLEEFCARQQLATPLHHVFEQTELAWQQIDRPFATLRGSIDEIKLQRSYAQHRHARLGGRPNRLLDARIFFSYREWSSRLTVASQGRPVNNPLECAQEQRMNDAFQAAKIGWKRRCSRCVSPQSSWARRGRNSDWTLCRFSRRRYAMYSDRSRARSR